MSIIRIRVVDGTKESDRPAGYVRINQIRQCPQWRGKPLASHDETLFLMGAAWYLLYASRTPDFERLSAPGEREEWVEQLDHTSHVRRISREEAIRWFEAQGRDIPKELAGAKGKTGATGAPPPALAERLCDAIEGFDRQLTVAIACRGMRRHVHRLRADATAFITERRDLPPVPPLVDDDTENVRAMREWLSRALSIVEANPAAQTANDANAPAAQADDPSGYVPAKECLIGGITTPKKLKKYLAQHPEIRTRKPRKNRLKVFMADLVRAQARDRELTYKANDGGAMDVETLADIRAGKQARGK